MKKQLNWAKNSFTIIETLISLIIVSILISGFTKLIRTNSQYNTYIELQKAQNDFILHGYITNSYKGFTLKNL